MQDLVNNIFSPLKLLYMANKILTTYKYASDTNLLSTIHRVLGKMDNNANFPQPPAALETLKKELPEFIVTLTNASGGDMEKTAIKNARKAVMVDLLKQLDDYVTLTSQGNRAKLLSSGFAITREKGDISMGDIKDLQVTINRPGEAITRIKRVTGAKAYIHQYTLEPATSNSVWTRHFVAEPSFTFSGLQSKERYLFKVIAVGVKGQEVSSPEIARVIQ
jgi:hypothetical protein